MRHVLNGVYVDVNLAVSRNNDNTSRIDAHAAVDSGVTSSVPSTAALYVDCEMIIRLTAHTSSTDTARTPRHYRVAPVHHRQHRMQHSVDVVHSSSHHQSSN